MSADPESELPDIEAIRDYLQMLQGSWMSRPNTIVVPGGKMGLSMEIILNPIVHNVIDQQKKARQ